MVDTLGWRVELGVLVPSTNTSVQPEYDDMRPPGVTNHVSGFRIPDAPTRTDAEFKQQLENMRATMVDAMDEVLTLDPASRRDTRGRRDPGRPSPIGRHHARRFAALELAQVAARISAIT